MQILSLNLNPAKNVDIVSFIYIIAEAVAEFNWDHFYN
jgi:hypothetical protein